MQDSDTFATFLIAAICVALNTVAVADAAVAPIDKTLDAVFKSFSFFLPASVLSSRILSLFTKPLVIVPIQPTTAPTDEEIIAPLPRLFIGVISTYSYSRQALYIFCASLISSPDNFAANIALFKSFVADIHASICP